MAPVARSACLMFGMAVVSITPAVGAELKVEPRAGVGISYYDLDVTGAVVVGNDSVNDIRFSDWLYVVGGGLTFSYDRFFVDAYGQYSFDGQDTLNLDVVAGGVAINNFVQSVDFDRIETSLSAGYRFTDQFAAYVGFRYADVTFDGSGSLGNQSANFTTDFNQQGAFVGAGYIVPKPVFEGAFVVNAAVTYLDGDLKNKLDVNPPLNDVEFDIKGDAIGVNGGVSWVRPISDRFKLVIGADVSQYSFKDNDGDADFDELIARFRTELRYNFDSSALSGQ